MSVGIDASRAFQKNRTGIEEYSYQVIKYLKRELKNEKVFLYLRKNQKVDFALPENWKIKVIKFPYLWTQIGLSLELLFHPVNVLFIPAHIIPVIHPKNTVVTIHGLEYEFCPKAYSFWERLYVRWAIKKSCRWAKKIIAVSENTKKDLINLYKVPEEKIEVIYEGISENDKYQMSNVKSNPKLKIPNLKKVSFRAERSVVEESRDEKSSRSLDFARDDSKKYLLFIGRLEERKNIIGIIKAFEVLKEKYKISHQLILAGGEGHNYKKIVDYLSDSSYKSDIILLGFVSEEEKWELLKKADVFLFPTFYEGFGLPILEAQSVGVPVVASDNSSIPEIVCHSERSEESLSYRNNSNLSSGSFANAQDDRCSAVLVNPSNPSEIAEVSHKFISDKALRDDIIEKGYENVKRFSWEKCTIQIAKLLDN